MAILTRAGTAGNDEGSAAAPFSFRRPWRSDGGRKLPGLSPREQRSGFEHAISPSIERVRMVALGS
jgi:hypothetical protein